MKRPDNSLLVDDLQPWMPNAIKSVSNLALGFVSQSWIVPSSFKINVCREALLRGVDLINVDDTHSQTHARRSGLSRGPTDLSSQRNAGR